jgi:hypothetical protein
MIRVKGEGNTKRSKLQLEVGDGPSHLGKLKVALQFGHLFHQSHLYPELTLGN